MIENAKQILLTARIGDGCLIRQSETSNASANYMGIVEDYIQYKHDVLSESYSCSDVRLRDNSAGFNKNGIIYTFSVHTHPDITDIYSLSKIEIISQLDYFGFLIYFFDDGSYHKVRNTMHIYCNSFLPNEVEALKTKIFELFPYKLCRDRVDKKKDGRQYPYLYIPRVTVEGIKEYYTKFVKSKKLLNCMLYKLGSPPQTIEKN